MFDQSIKMSLNTSTILSPPLDAHALSTVKDKVVKAKARLVLDHPFFGMAVSKRDLIYDYNTKTASMNGNWSDALEPTLSCATHGQEYHLSIGSRSHALYVLSFDKAWRT